MTKSDARRIAAALLNMSVAESESAIEGITVALGEEAREKIIDAICELNTVRKQGKTHPNVPCTAYCFAIGAGLGVKMRTEDRRHVITTGNKSTAFQKFADAWELNFAIKNIAPDHGRTHNVRTLYPVRSLFPEQQQRKIVNVNINLPVERN